MNFLTSKAFLGYVPSLVYLICGMLTKFGVDIPTGLDTDIINAYAVVASIYLVYTGHTEALNTPVPPPVIKGTMLIGQNK